MFLASERGKRALNFCYSWGASIVIIGALFKLLHLPYGNQILFVAMTVEALVFFISAFEHPSSEYHWEEVFPVLKSKNPMDRPDFAKQGEEPQVAGMAPGVHIHTGGAGTPGIDLEKMGLNLKEEDSKKLSESIQKLNGAAEQIGKMAELTEATQKYLEQLSTMSDNMARFSTVTGELTNVSGTLLDSYKSITDNSDDLTQNSQNYVQQMSQLQQHVAQLNAIYEAQAKNIAAQMEAVGERHRPQRDRKDDAPARRAEPGLRAPAASDDRQHGIPSAGRISPAAHVPTALSATLRLSAAAASPV